MHCATQNAPQPKRATGAKARKEPKREGRRLAAVSGADEEFLPAPMVWGRYHICEMTLGRWVKDPRKNFPKPVYFGRFRYWRLSDLLAWEYERITARAA
jgi:predicted DNA-binding transcriptional regulator AlpA